MLEYLNYVFKTLQDSGDPRIKHLPMMQTPFPGLVMVIGYVYFVEVAGPQLMAKREPFQLRGTMIFYNLFQVILHLFFFISGGWYGWFRDYSWMCQPIDYSMSYRAVRMAQLGYLYYLSKFIQFADTIIFVFRKKYNQISTLHVMHHSLIPLLLWFGVKFVPGGHYSFFSFINSFVHVIMYTYYGLAALGEKYKKYLFWKKLVTYIQIIQFVVVIGHSTLLYLNCDTPIVFTLMNLSVALLFFALFINFFIKTYTKETKKPRIARKRIDPVYISENTISVKKPSNGFIKQRSKYSTKNQPTNLASEKR